MIWNKMANLCLKIKIFSKNLNRNSFIYGSLFIAKFALAAASKRGFEKRSLGFEKRLYLFRIAFENLIQSILAANYKRCKIEILPKVLTKKSWKSASG